jgi:hypothetical protein
VFHVKHLDGAVAAEHFGGDREPDWRVERRPDGTLWWIVVDWHGETIASGVRPLLGEAVAECVRWAA